MIVSETVGTDNESLSQTDKVPVDTTPRLYVLHHVWCLGV